MAETGNYQLKQWESGDRILMEDFHADNAKVDQALGILAEQAAQIANCGNCSISSFVYTGTGACGAENPTVLNFTKSPAAFVIWPIANTNTSTIGNGMALGRGGDAVLRCFGINPSTGKYIYWDANAAWNGGELRLTNSDTSMSGHYQFNNARTTYLVIAFYAS